MGRTHVSRGGLVEEERAEKSSKETEETEITGTKNLGKTEHDRKELTSWRNERKYFF